MILHILGPIWTAIVLLQASSSLGLEPCKVDCSHYGSALGSLTDDPFNCKMYYVCLSGFEYSPYPFSCPEEQSFDTVTKQCMAYGYKCSDACQKCSYSCTNSILGQASNSTSCSSYFHCSGGEGILSVCPEDRPYFDGNTCQTDVNKCCSCRPECSESDAANHVELPDYNNCTNYYLCVAPGIPDDTSHGHCPTGNFNQVTGVCDDAAECNSTCTNSVEDSDCVDNFICEEEGFFPRCTESCDPIYYFCSAGDLGFPAQAYRCTNDYVVDPFTVICIPPEDCPV